MTVVVIAPPAALVTPSEAKLWAPVLSEDADERVTALLAVAQAAIEPPSGWVGRAFGVQTLESRFTGFCDARLRLPFPPLREIRSIVYVDEAGAEHTVPAEAYRTGGIGTDHGWVVSVPGLSWPVAAREAENVRVRFEAGYASDDPQLLPAKHAVVLGAMHLRSLGTQDLALRSRDVVGVGSRTWTVSDAAEKLVRSAVDALLTPLRIYA